MADHGGWRVDTRSETEWCRYVFATASGLAELARRIDRPRVFLKLCAEDDILMRLLPARWTLRPTCWVMTAGAKPPDRPLPAGYRSRIRAAGGAIEVSILASDGALAASGHAAEAAGFFVYDRIVTSPDHRRRGLGHAVMTTLRSRCRSERSCEVLVATEQGRALYTALGWEVHSTYATAVSPDPAA